MNLVGTIQKHYKGNLYKVLYIATHTETLEQYVVYKRVFTREQIEKGQDIMIDKKIWARPLSMFLSKKWVGDCQINRFTHIKNCVTHSFIE